MDFEMFKVDQVRPVQPISDYVAVQVVDATLENNIAQKRTFFRQWITAHTRIANAHCTKADLDGVQTLKRVADGVERDFQWYPPMTLFEGECQNWTEFVGQHGAHPSEIALLLGLVTAVENSYREAKHG